MFFLDCRVAGYHSIHTAEPAAGLVSNGDASIEKGVLRVGDQDTCHVSSPVSMSLRPID
jgi:hypothetical protein